MYLGHKICKRFLFFDHRHFSHRNVLFEKLFLCRQPVYLMHNVHSAYDLSERRESLLIGIAAAFVVQLRLIAYAY